MRSNFLRRVFYTVIGAIMTVGAFAASDLVLSTGITFQPGFRLVDGTDLNTVLAAVNTLRDQADGTATSTPTFTTATVNTGIVPDANDGAYIGTTALSWSDIFLASGGVINWNNGSTTLTQSAGALALAGSGAGALTVGPNGATNPTLQVDASAMSAATGIKITGAAAAGGVAVAAISSGADEALSLNAKGAGTIAVGNVSTGAVTITPATTITGALTPTGGVAAAGGFSVSCRLMATGNEPAIATTSGTNLDIVTTETYRAEIFVPATCSSTGVAVFNGTAVAGNLKAYLIKADGTQVTGVLTASTAASGTTAYQLIPWASGPFTIVGPATYYIAVQGSDAGGDLRTHTVGTFGADKQTGTTYGTLTAAAAPTTFTTGLGPIASLY